MRLRGRTVLLSALLLLAGGTLSLPAVHWRPIGWWRGEAFYQARPTSWWEQEIESSFVPVVSVGCLFGERPANMIRRLRAAPVTSWQQRQRLPWWSWQRLKRGTGGPPPVSEIEAPLTAGDAEAIGVLLQLLHSQSTTSRRVACFGLGHLREVPEVAVEDLARMAANDRDVDVRRAAARSVNKIRWPLTVPVSTVSDDQD